jgi:hypothetical protein
MIDVPEVEERLRRTFDAVAATTRVDLPPRQRHFSSRVSRGPIVAIVAAGVAIVAVLLLVSGHDSSTHVRTNTPSSATSTKRLRSLPGLIVVASEDGHQVGYLKQWYLHIPPRIYKTRVNARTLWPVTDANGVVVGYIAPDVPFVSLAETRQPGFDVEKVRAARRGGCEDQIGDPNFKQEFPPCNGGKRGR